MHKDRFNGQVAIVTGAGRGLGRAYAIDLAKRGAAVVVSDIAGGGASGEPDAGAVVEEITATGGRAVSVSASVATREGGQTIVDAALDTFGTVDIVVNNAGILRPAMFEDMTDEQLHEVMDVHLFGAFYVTQPAWKVMRQKGYGRVVLTSSSSVLGMQGNSNYVTAKAGLVGLARCLALEGAPHDIRVNCVMPFAASSIRQGNEHVGEDAQRSAAAQNAMTHRRTTESVSPLVLYLASTACSVTGEAFSALAGRYARIFLGLTDGWLTEDANGVTVEQIGELIGRISDPTTYAIPTRMIDELESVLARIQVLEGAAASHPPVA